MDGLKKFWSEYKGIIIGGVIALLIALTGLYKLIICIVLVAVGMFAGNYIQRNKFSVKEKVKDFIDRL